MSVKGELPEELLEFLRMEGGHSLIVHGEPGSGKTTLFLQLIEALDAEQKTLYISTRVSDMSLYLQFPWLRDRVRRNRLLMDARSFLRSISVDPAMASNYEDIQRSARALLNTLFFSGDYEMPDTVVRRELQKLEGFIEGEDDFDASDGESLIFDMGSDMPEIDLAYDTVEAALPERTLIVFDSIDALSEKYGLPSNKLIMTIQKDLVESSGANVVYILESSGSAHIDYLADGVIYLTMEELEGRRYRQLIISKLRGFEIRNHRHTISLSGGRISDMSFEEWPRLKNPPLWNMKAPFHDGDCYSTGNRYIDSILGGGLSPSDTLLIEVSSDAPRDYLDGLLLQIVAQFAREGHGVSFLPQREMSREEVAKSMSQKIIPFEEIEENIHLLEPAGSSGFTDRSATNWLDGSDLKTDLDWEGIKYSLRKKKAPFLSIVAMDSLQAIYGSDAPLHLFEHIGAVKGSNGIFIAIMDSTDEHLERIAAISRRHLVMDMLHNAPVIYGKKPFSGFYGMKPSVKDGSILLELIPIS